MARGAGRGATRRSVTYLYRKLIFQQDGLTPFGMARTKATGKVQRNGNIFRAEIVIDSRT